VASASEQYVTAWVRLAGLAAEIPGPAWDAPSPCGAWNARQVAGHLLDGERQVRAMLEARTPPAPVTDPAVLAELGTDPVGDLRDAAERVRTTVDALDPSASIATPHGGLGVDQFLAMALIEPVVHGWDLSAATGRPLALDEEAVAVLLDGVERLGGRLAATGMYAPAVPVRDDASPVVRLLAALGRG
jgi:uncharacterized protein (TIGR03086 family)